MSKSFYVEDYEKSVLNRTRTNLVDLYGEPESKLRALDSLRYTQDKYGKFLASLVESCLQDGTLITWERQCSAEDFRKH